MKRKTVHNVLSAITVSILLTGCSNKQAETNNTKNHENHAEHIQTSDIREQTINKETLPKFLSDQEQQIQQIYMVASQHVDLLKNIPCYCGCGESVGHKSNLDCFIHEVKEDGSIVWDSHATSCVNCMEIAVESAKLQQEGKTALEIRKVIDNKYKEGYAKPTNTPMQKEQG